MLFTKPKFFRLDTEQQHKKCAEMLRLVYEGTLENKDVSSIFSHYNELLSWLKLPPFDKKNLKNISDQYHLHLSLAKVNLKEHNLLPSLRTGDKNPKMDFSKNAIFLDNIRSAYNVGSILRTTEALRIGSVYFAEKTPFTDNKKVIKTAMGSSEIVPCHQKNTIEDLPKPLIVLDTSDSSINLFDFIFPETFTLVLGNEEYGTSDEVLKDADYILEIPMLGHKNSINVACAYGMAAAQYRKQHPFKNL